MQKQVILIVEDSDDDYETTIRAFKTSGNLGNPIYRCEDGEEALDYLFQRGEYSQPNRAPKPGIILLDLNLPAIEGQEVLKEIKSHEALREIPVVVLTTSDDEKDIERCYSLGASTYIQKPVDLVRFFYAIQRLNEYWFDIALLPKDEQHG